MNFEVFTMQIALLAAEASTCCSPVVWCAGLERSFHGVGKVAGRGGRGGSQVLLSFG